jgi:alpha-tubulin suppressor-like RCC1 family protein
LLEPIVNSEIDGGAILIQAACCGAESSHVLDAKGNVYSTGWNEHGNLAVGHVDSNDVDGEYLVKWTVVSGANVVAPPPSTNRKEKMIAAGGAHLIVMAV